MWVGFFFDIVFNKPFWLHTQNNVESGDIGYCCHTAPQNYFPFFMSVFVFCDVCLLGNKYGIETGNIIIAWDIFGRRRTCIEKN